MPACLRSSSTPSLEPAPPRTPQSLKKLPHRQLRARSLLLLKRMRSLLLLKKAQSLLLLKRTQNLLPLQKARNLLPPKKPLISRLPENHILPADDRTKKTGIRQDPCFLL